MLMCSSHRPRALKSALGDPVKPREALKSGSALREAPDPSQIARLHRVVDAHVELGHVDGLRRRAARAEDHQTGKEQRAVGNRDAEVAPRR